MSNPENTAVNIIIGGDVCPIGRNESLFCNGTAHEILGDLMPIWMNADVRIVNLECPLIASPSPIRKTGLHFGADELTVNGLKSLGIDVAGIANNHILDHGSNGLLNTVRLCRENGIVVVGGGADLFQAREPLIQNIKGLRLGIIAMADLEWSVADRHSAGANPFSMCDFLKAMRHLRNECDYIISLMHLGKEHYPYPSPNLQETCRCLVEEGVSIVVCQHSHCAGACESYDNGFICYGQGNFLFDIPKNRLKSWRLGYLLGVTFVPDSSPRVSLIPLTQRQDGRGVELLEPREVKEFQDRMKVMEQEIQDAELVERKWIEFCREKRDLYLSILAGHGRLRRKFNQLTGLIDHLYSSDAIATLENVVRCEAHHEVLQSILYDLRRERWDGKKNSMNADENNS